MRYMASYDLMESIRNTNQWLGASAQALASYPITGLSPNPFFKLLAAWGEVTERTYSRMVTRPDWNIFSVPADDGRDHVVHVEKVVEKPFGDLIQFRVQGRRPKLGRQILLVAPMSGHYATLLRSTVASLLPDCEVFITDWHNARNIPVSAGKFDIEDYTLYLAEFIETLGPAINVIAVCQPAPLTLAATAYLAETKPEALPRSLTLIGGPIDPDAAATDVTDFGRRVTMGQLEETMIQQVGYLYAGVGRKVYPGLLQLASFMSMNAETHTNAFIDQILRVAKGEAEEHDRHNRFYDEYLAVMDMTAEFYLSTVERIFKGREIADNIFVVNGTKIDLGNITTVPVKTVEGDKDDITAPGQCIAALSMLKNLPDDLKASHVEPGAGHYGIFAGQSWRDNIRPLVFDFIDKAATLAKARENAAAAAAAPVETAAAAAPVETAPATVAPVEEAEVIEVSNVSQISEARPAKRKPRTKKQA